MGKWTFSSIRAHCDAKTATLILGKATRLTENQGKHEEDLIVRGLFHNPACPVVFCDESVVFRVALTLHKSKTAYLLSRNNNIDYNKSIKPALSNYWRVWLMLMCAVEADVDRCSWYQKCIESQLTVVERKGSWEEISSSSPQAGIWLEQIGLCLLLCVSEPVSIGSVEVWLSLNADSWSSGSVKAPYVLCHTNWEHFPGISSFTFSPGSTPWL